MVDVHETAIQFLSTCVKNANRETTSECRLSALGPGPCCCARLRLWSHCSEGLPDCKSTKSEVVCLELSNSMI